MEVEKQIEQPNSCEISINAKGQYSGKVKVYAETIEGALTLAKEKAQELNALIKSKNEV
jgi:hypothetical protein|tara:strand:+ start:798 stop:974 length:177 start_codon:yes stop_codon:yes gene_type:complete